MDHMGTIQIYLGLDMEINIVNRKSFTVWWCLYATPSNIWSSIHDKVKKHWGWAEKKRCLYKSVYL